MYNFCTYFDSNYLIKGLALYRSLTRHAAPFRLWVLCFDDLTYETLQQLAFPEVVPISLGDFEEADEDLLQVKRDRSRIEYYFTCTPSLPLYVLINHPDVDLVTYLDADLFFFSDPTPIYEELGDGSILIIGHRFPETLKHLERYGIHNVGFLSFRNDSNGLRCLTWWRERCIDWCYDRVEDGRFADQKYLDDWPSRLPGVVVLEHKGAGLAPWNVGGYTVREGRDSVLVDSDPLIFYHFHQLETITPFLFNPNLDSYGTQLDTTLRRRIYGPYLRELQSLMRQEGLGRLGNPRHRGSHDRRELIRLLLYGRTLLVVGPVTAEVHLEPMGRPLLSLRKLALHGFRSA